MLAFQRTVQRKKETYGAAHLALRDQAGPLVTKFGVLVQDLLGQSSELRLTLVSILSVCLLETLPCNQAR
jgi:hypothetical protein